MAFSEKGCTAATSGEVSYLTKIAGQPSSSVLPASGNKSSEHEEDVPEVDTCDVASMTTGDTVSFAQSIIVVPDKIYKPPPCPKSNLKSIVIVPRKPASPPPMRRPPPRAKPKSKSKSPVKKKSATVQVPSMGSCNLRKEEEPVDPKKKKKPGSKSRSSSPALSTGSRASSTGKNKGKRKRNTDESFLERLSGLSEMFPEPVRDFFSSFGENAAEGVKIIYTTSCNAAWIFFTSSLILFAPIVFETERAQLESIRKCPNRLSGDGPGRR